MKWDVSSLDHGATLLCFLKKKLGEGVSSNKLKKSIDSKCCKVNGRVEFFSSFLLKEGDVVELRFVETKGAFSIPILFEDEFFVLVDKPSGLVCEHETVAASLGNRAKKWRLAHRLDKDTSGLLLLAKTIEAENLAKDLFSKRQVQKLYLAIVDGKMKEKEGCVDNFLGKKGGYQGQTIYGEVKENGLRAITEFKCLISNDQASLVLCNLKTGRTHQIRVHLSEKGHPLLGDHQYSRQKRICLLETERQLLHAWKLSFIHPITCKKMDFEAPIPSDFKQAIQTLFPFYKL